MSPKIPVKAPLRARQYNHGVSQSAPGEIIARGFALQLLGVVAALMPTANSDLFEVMDVSRLPRNAISMCILSTVLAIFRSAFRSRASVELENFALRHQLNVLKRSVKQRPKLTPADRLFVGRPLARLG